MTVQKLLLPGSAVLSAAVLSAAMTFSAVAQSGADQSSQQGAASAPAQQSGQSAQGTNAAPSGTAVSGTATGQPLATQSKEGFWGHLNPMARKKWVNRQVTPVKDRLNELDQLTSKNASDIKDLDARSQAGIRKAQDTAETAAQQANAANAQAGQAQQLAQQASSRADQLNQTVSNLDQYSSVADTEIRFRPGQTVLNEKAKEALDQVAQQAQGQKGYIIEVEGYSHSRGQAGIENSQHLADAVVRYLVEKHQIPIFRIHQVAMGNAPVEAATTAGETGNTGTNGAATSSRGSLVRVMLMHNSLAAANGSAQTGSSPIGSTQQQGAASQPQP